MSTTPTPEEATDLAIGCCGHGAESMDICRNCVIEAISQAELRGRIAAFSECAEICDKDSDGTASGGAVRHDIAKAIRERIAKLKKGSQ